MIRNLPGWADLASVELDAELERRVVRLESVGGWGCDEVTAERFVHDEEHPHLFRRIAGSVTLSRLWKSRKVEAQGDGLEAAVTEAEKLQLAIQPRADRFAAPGVPVKDGLSVTGL